MKAEQPHKNTIQLTTAAPSTLQNIMFWNIDGAENIFLLQQLTASPIFFSLISNLHYRTVVDYFTFFTLENKI